MLGYVTERMSLEPSVLRGPHQDHCEDRGADCNGQAFRILPRAPRRRWRREHEPARSSNGDRAGVEQVMESGRDFQVSTHERAQRDGE